MRARHRPYRRRSGYRPPARRYQPRDHRGRYTRNPRPHYDGPWWGPVLILGIAVLLVVLASL